MTGQKYEDALRARLFEPLGLRTLRQCAPLPSEPNEARGHVRRRGVVEVAAPENMNWIRGDGGICGSVLDLARWTRLPPAASYRLMTTPTPVRVGGEAPYGFTLSLLRPDGCAKIANGGAMLGYPEMAAYYPDAGLTIAVTANRGGAGADAIEPRIHDVGIGGIDQQRVDCDVRQPIACRIPARAAVVAPPDPARHARRKKPRRHSRMKPHAARAAAMLPGPPNVRAFAAAVVENRRVRRDNAVRE